MKTIAWVFMGTALAVPLAVARTIEVPAEHATLRAALEAAERGDTVLVAAGTYKERVRLKPGVTLRSAGDDGRGEIGLLRAEKTIIDGSGAVAEGEDADPGVAMAEGAVLDGFTVTGVGEYDEAKWNEHFETRGANQPHEHIGHFGAPGVGADGVTCKILNNIVHHNGHTGIAIRGEEGREVAPEVRGNTCFRNMGGGIGIMRKATGVVSGNTCYENFYAGIGHSGASPLVEKNECHGNVRAGIGISEGACPTVRSNKCYRNRRAGIGTRTGEETAPTIEDNDCYENGMAGIGTDEGAAPTIRGNRCFRNELAGIGSRANSKPVILENEVRENQAAGIGFDECEAGEAVVRGNRVFGNKLVAVGVHRGWKVVFEGNEFGREGGLPPMMMVFEGAECEIRDNSFQVSGVAGVRVAGSVRVVGNRFDGGVVRRGGPPHFGVWALPGAEVVVEDNQFKSLRHALHASDASVVARSNTAADFPSVAFVVQNPRGPAEVRDNVAIAEGDGVKVVQVEGDQAKVQGNVVRKP